MVTLQYYDELKEAVKVPSSITDFFASSVDDSNEEKLFYSVMLEVGLPVEKWLFYVITHEENAFKRFFDCKPNENDRRLCPKELFYCLRPLSDENRRFIFGKLSDISDGVINKLSKYVEEDNLVEFSNVINETNINTSSIASICMNVKALIDNYDAMEQLYLNVGQIIQIDDEAEMFRQMEKVFNVFLSNFESINGDEQATDQVVNYVNSLAEELSRNENFSEVASDLTIKKYHFCLWLYHLIQSDNTQADNNQSNGFVTRVALDYLEELVFNPKYEKYWKGYEDDTCLGELDKEMKNWFGVAIEENQKEQKEEVMDVPQKRQKIAQETDDDSKTQDFREATIGFKATELYSVIEELLNEIEGREREFFGDNYDLNDLKGLFEDILIFDAGENIDTQRAIIDELSGNKRVSLQSPYYYKGRLWLQPFFIILGHLYNKGVWKGDQLSFVKALFPDMHNESPIYGVVYKYDKKFIDACRAKVSLGNTTLFKEPKDSKKLNVKWKKWFEWIDTLLS